MTFPLEIPLRFPSLHPRRSLTRRRGDGLARRITVVALVALASMAWGCEPVMGDKQSRVMGYTLVVVGGWI